MVCSKYCACSNFSGNPTIKIDSSEHSTIPLTKIDTITWALIGSFFEINS